MQVREANFLENDDHDLMDETNHDNENLRRNVCYPPTCRFNTARKKNRVVQKEVNSLKKCEIFGIYPNNNQQQEKIPYFSPIRCKIMYYCTGWK
jgi:hypothetical protein